MKKALAVALMFSTSVAIAETPMDMFTATNNMTDKTEVTWVQVDNIQATCESESKKRGFGGFGVPMEGCSFWDKKVTGHTCVIITQKKVNYWTLGHELRHCFQGAFHKF